MRRAHYRPPVSPAWAANAATTGAATLAPADAFMALMDGRTILDLAEGFSFAASASWRLSHRADRLHRGDARAARAYGLFSEIISWKLRFFVPTDTPGLRCWSAAGPLSGPRIGEREAA
jgi:hypothetical protein